MHALNNNQNNINYFEHTLLEENKKLKSINDNSRNILPLKQRKQDLMLLKQLKKLKNLSNFQKLLIIKLRIKIL